jgi:hypothetical protein
MGDGRWQRMADDGDETRRDETRDAEIGDEGM